MRIHSSPPFRDYYDSMLQYGADSSITYHRIQSSMEVIVDAFPSIKRVLAPWLYPTTDIVGFCGRIYPAIYMDRSQPGYLFSLRDFDNYVKQNCAERTYELYMGARPKSREWKSWILPVYKIRSARKIVEAFFERCRKVQNDFVHLFREWDCPIFQVMESTDHNNNDKYLLKNPCLTKLQFYKVLPAQQAFQELLMWLSNEVEPRKPIPKISDEDMIEIKGFDKRSSFRKDKKEKK